MRGPRRCTRQEPIIEQQLDSIFAGCDTPWPTSADPLMPLDRGTDWGTDRETPAPDDCMVVKLLPPTSPKSLVGLYLIPRPTPYERRGG